MAQKRMFDRAIIDTDRFMDMPLGTKAAYFLLGMEADDEGFVSHKKVMRIHGISEDDIKLMALKGFVIIFPSGVSVITDWNKNNWLDARRSKPTEYQIEKKMLSLTPTKEYVLSEGLASIEESRGEERSTEEIATETVAEEKTDEKGKKLAKVSKQAFLILDEFIKINSSCASYKKNLTQLNACDLLVKDKGLQTVLSVIPRLSKTNDDPFFPTITTPVQLYEKWAALMAAKNKKANRGEMPGAPAQSSSISSDAIRFMEKKKREAEEQAEREENAKSNDNLRKANELMKSLGNSKTVK